MIFPYKILALELYFSGKWLSLHQKIKWSLKQCRIKNWKETHSFPSRNPFILYTSLFYWLSERYKYLESFSGVVCCNKHLCPFLTLTQRCSSQDRGITTFGKLHQLADKNFLLGCRWYVVQYLILLRSVDTDVFGGTKIANLRIKVVGMNVISWLLIESRIYDIIKVND